MVFYQPLDWWMIQELKPTSENFPLELKFFQLGFGYSEIIRPFFYSKPSNIVYLSSLNLLF